MGFIFFKKTWSKVLKRDIQSKLFRSVVLYLFYLSLHQNTEDPIWCIFLEKNNNRALFDGIDFQTKYYGDIPGSKRTGRKILLIGMLKLSAYFHIFQIVKWQ
jgi:hypothetical protein